MNLKATKHYDLPDNPQTELYSVELRIPIMLEYMNPIQFETTSDPSVLVTLNFTLDEWDEIFDAIKNAREDK